MSTFDIAALKVGDKVAYISSSAYGSRRVRHTTIARMTKTQIITADDMKFYSPNGRFPGRRVGNYYSVLVALDSREVVESLVYDEFHRVHGALETRSKTRPPKTVEELHTHLSHLQEIINVARGRTNNLLKVES